MDEVVDLCEVCTWTLLSRDFRKKYFKITECFFHGNMLSAANTGNIDIATYCNVLDHNVNMIKRPKVIGPNS